MTDEWYESADWSRQGQAKFWKRLDRARDKSQYLYLKALALLEAGGVRRRAGARQLLHQLLTDYPDSFHEAIAHEHLGVAYEQENEFEQAEFHYREALRLYPANHQRGHAHLLLPEMLVRTGQEDKYEEMALLLLDSLAAQGWTMNDELFRIQVARARIADALGQDDVASDCARAALDLADITEPQLPRHPTVGLVKTDDRTVQELMNLRRSENDS
jgi:tetratricopeptide (TPR) repeat protein